MDPFAAAIRRTISRWQMIAAGEKLLVGVSGGADSMALLAVLRELGCDTVAAHFNHRWRGAESDRDEAFVHETCARWQIPLVAASALHPGAPAPARSEGGPEQRARHERYEFLRRMADTMGCSRIATGHTRDDQAETVLLRLLRGTGIEGLAGIHPVRRDGVVRPLLEVGREEVIAYLDRRGIEHIEDSSNADRRFGRNRLRLDVLPLLRQFNPRVNERLAAVASALSVGRRRDRLLVSRLLRHRLDDEGRLPLERLGDLTPALRRQAVARWLRRVRGGSRRITAAHIEGVVDCQRSGASVALPAGERVLNEHGYLRWIGGRADEAAPGAIVALGAATSFGSHWCIEATAPEDVDSGGIRLPDNLLVALLDADRVEMPLRVRPWRHGDRVQPLGMSGHRKLSDVFIDAKVPRWRRAHLPVVECGGGILWVPGVVRAAMATVDAGTRRVLRLRASAGPV